VHNVHKSEIYLNSSKNTNSIFDFLRFINLFAYSLTYLLTYLLTNICAVQ